MIPTVSMTSQTVYQACSSQSSKIIQRLGLQEPDSLVSRIGLLLCCCDIDAATWLCHTDMEQERASVNMLHAWPPKPARGWGQSVILSQMPCCALVVVLSLHFWFVHFRSQLWSDKIEATNAQHSKKKAAHAGIRLRSGLVSVPSTWLPELDFCSQFTWAQQKLSTFCLTICQLDLGKLTVC